MSGCQNMFLTENTEMFLAVMTAWRVRPDIVFYLFCTMYTALKLDDDELGNDFIHTFYSTRIALSHSYMQTVNTVLEKYFLASNSSIRITVLQCPAARTFSYRK